MIQIAFSFLLLIAGVSCVSLQANDPDLKAFFPLPANLSECSGVIPLGNNLYAGNNDSGNPAEICVFSQDPKIKPRLVRISGSSNMDWEELATDGQYIYISDTGDNNSTRKYLVVYRVKKEDLLTRDEAVADTILFSYPEDMKALPGNGRNFDCEALICFGDSLYLFTKNRGNFKTDSYSIPKRPGNYTAKHLGTFDAGGLVTGADFRISGDHNELVLIGYSSKEKGYHPFVLYFSHVAGVDFFGDPPLRKAFSGSLQTESIAFLDVDKVIITNERNHAKKGYMYSFDLREIK